MMLLESMQSGEGLTLLKDVKLNSLLGEHACLTCFAHYIICSKTSTKFGNLIFDCRRRHLSFTTLLAFFKQLSARKWRHPGLQHSWGYAPLEVL